jgi:phospholipid transport system substrate-binding protein
MMKNKLLTIIAFFTIIGFKSEDSYSIFSQKSSAPGDFITHLGENAIQTLTNPNISLEKRQKECELFLEEFDFNSIGRFVIGRYWRLIKPEQKKKYLKLFKQFLIQSYVNKFEGYSDTQFKVLKTHEKADSEFMVDSILLLPNGNELNLQWKVFGTPNNYRVLDITLDNISMSITQRNEFYALLEKLGGNFDEFLNTLKQKNEE